MEWKGYTIAQGKVDLVPQQQQEQQEQLPPFQDLIASPHFCSRRPLPREGQPLGRRLPLPAVPGLQPGERLQAHVRIRGDTLVRRGAVS